MARRASWGVTWSAQQAESEVNMVHIGNLTLEVHMKRMTTVSSFFSGSAFLTILLVSAIASAHTYAPPSPPQQLSDDVPHTPVPFPCSPDPAFPFNTANESEIYDSAVLGKEGAPVIAVNPVNTHVID